MNYERRERYAAAMAEAHDAGPEWAFEWYPEADAAMAVADAERVDFARLSNLLGFRDLEEENARLRATIARVRGVLDEYGDDPFAQFLATAVRSALEDTEHGA